jgi:hypothetical protein
MILETHTPPRNLNYFQYVFGDVVGKAQISARREIVGIFIVT